MTAAAAMAAPDALPVHPLADIFPAMRDQPFAVFLADIEANGLREEILLHWDGRLLDGRARLKACAVAGIPPRFRRWDGSGDLVALLISLNLHRRHLDESQRAMVAAKLESFGWGGARQDRLPHPGPHGQGQAANLQLGCGGSPVITRLLEERGVSRAKAAALLNVSERSIASAAVVRDHAVSGLAACVEQGDVAVSVAETVARRPAADQADIVARGRTEILQAAKIFKLENLATKRLRREAREAELAGATARAATRLGSRLYNVIYADCPWAHETYSAVTGGARAAANHYPTMPIDEICALQVPAAPNCVLFFWRMPHMIREALRAVEAWGFDLKSEIVWVKDKIGLGYWSRQKHEALWICTRGDIPAPSPGTQLESVQHAPLGRHSEKPALFAEWIERTYPTVPKLEMFARAPRPGWDVWGNEATPLETYAEAAHG